MVYSYIIILLLLGLLSVPYEYAYNNNTYKHEGGQVLSLTYVNERERRMRI